MKYLIYLKKKINCLFYEVIKNCFSFNFKDKIDNLEENDSYLIYQNQSWIYEEQGEYQEEEIFL